jgi:hypothetical protein
MSEFFIACSFYDSFGSFCPIYSKKVWQITKKCCKMTFLLKENLRMSGKSCTFAAKICGSPQKNAIKYGI